MVNDLLDEDGRYLIRRQSRRAKLAMRSGRLTAGPH